MSICGVYRLTGVTDIVSEGERSEKSSRRMARYLRPTVRGRNGRRVVSLTPSSQLARESMQTLKPVRADLMYKDEDSTLYRKRSER